MPSLFAALWSSVQTNFDAMFGEPVDLLPQIINSGSKYLRLGDDPGTPRRSLIGIFNDDSIVDTVKGSGANTHENIDVLTRRTSIDFDQTLFDGFPLPAQGWIIVATSQPRLPRYSVVTAEYDGLSRVICKVTFLDYSA
jgi:hypothetical protein